MKHFIKTAIVVFILSAFVTLKSFSQTVYVSETGKKYHKKNCSVGGTDKKGMTVAEAKKAGYTACGVCKPDEGTAAPKAADKPKAADNKPAPAATPKAADPKKPAPAPANKPK